MAWKIEIEHAASKELDRLETVAARRILRFSRERVSPPVDPRAMGEALTGPKLGRFWKYRVGDYRVVPSIDDDAVRILVVMIGHRREVHR